MTDSKSVPNLAEATAHGPNRDPVTGRFLGRADELIARFGDDLDQTLDGLIRDLGPPKEGEECLYEEIANVKDIIKICVRDIKLHGLKTRGRNRPSWDYLFRAWPHFKDFYDRVRQPKPKPSAIETDLESYLTEDREAEGSDIRIKEFKL